MPGPDAFYLPDGDGFVATVNTRGPWSLDHQHAGPPAALLGRGLERALGADWFVGRVAFDIPRPVPIGRLEIEVAPAVGGRRVQRTEAVLRAGGEAVVHARATAVRRSAVRLPELPPLGVEPPPRPDALEETPFPFFQADEGYHRAMDVRIARGGFGRRQTTAWMRSRVALVDGEALSPLQRVLLAADSGNGVSNVLTPERYLFVNPDLSVHLHRLPEGEWVCLDAYTTPEPWGVGLAHSRLHDVRGPIGHALQSLLIAERRP